MIKNIVVEGPNNVGKSTLIEKLISIEKFSSWRLEHLTEKSPNTYEFYDATLSNCDKTIFDRHCFGETVYPKLFNRENSLSVKDVIELVSKHNDTLFVIMSADLNFINNAYANKKETPDWYFVTAERRDFEAIADELNDCLNVIYHKNSFDEPIYDLAEYINWRVYGGSI